jgi:hypothetical protein
MADSDKIDRFLDACQEVAKFPVYERDQSVFEKALSLACQLHPDYVELGVALELLEMARDEHSR